MKQAIGILLTLTFAPMVWGSDLTAAYLRLEKSTTANRLLIVENHKTNYFIQFIKTDEGEVLFEIPFKENYHPSKRMMENIQNILSQNRIKHEIIDSRGWDLDTEETVRFLIITGTWNAMYIDFESVIKKIFETFVGDSLNQGERIKDSDFNLIEGVAPL